MYQGVIEVVNKLTVATPIRLFLGRLLQDANGTDAFDQMGREATAALGDTTIVACRNPLEHEDRRREHGQDPRQSKEQSRRKSAK